jgi:hypothetical protein
LEVNDRGDLVDLEDSEVSEGSVMARHSNLVDEISMIFSEILYDESLEAEVIAIDLENETILNYN